MEFISRQWDPLPYTILEDSLPYTILLTISGSKKNFNKISLVEYAKDDSTDRAT